MPFLLITSQLTKPTMAPSTDKKVKYDPNPMRCINGSIAAMPAAERPQRTMFPEAAAALGLSWKISTNRALQVRYVTESQPL